MIFTVRGITYHAPFHADDVDVIDANGLTWQSTIFREEAPIVAEAMNLYCARLEAAEAEKAKECQE